MPKFEYRAISPSGEKITGIHESNSKFEITDMLRSNGYYPLKIEEKIESRNIEINIFQKITIKDIAIFCRQFYTMLDAGLTVNAALEILAQQTPNKKLKDIIKLVEDDVKRGETLSSAMGKYQDAFPNLLINMIEVGEESGNLDTIMLRMSDQYEKDNKINNKVRVAMIYPSILAVVAALVVAVLMVFVIPSFMETFESMGTELPAITKLLMSISGFISSNILFITLTIVILSVLFRIYAKTEHGMQTIGYLKLNLPIIDKLNEKIIVSRFTRTMSLLMSSGIPMIRSLELIADIVGNKIAEEIILKMRESVVRGEGIYKPISKSNIFPKMMATMVKIGEESGTLDDIMYKTADFYDDELESQIQATSAMIEPILIVVMGVVVGFIVVSIMLPMTSMYDSI
ncbi:type II secretion system F family protein [Romboutsia ilealis]|uniref:Type II secretion system F family protein n=1 Tax=Romboutsia faecis TaxID=2764597 RepID=A0ABR7JSV9_9FIRM|nr:type II secretion system F family protein [Romboutsia faecis]MBC5998007.1 type II secretion system F family protein [Romboutsia faecis]MRN25698.1 type II secretion system F family protein [Romboutsia ilealis]